MNTADHLAPAPFVLVHGGRHGGWCWRPVAQRLRAAGHEVLTPTLTGLGDRSHLLDRSIGLNTHVQDLVAAVEFEDLTDVVLVAHSYGGMPVSGAMEFLAERIRYVVYLDAHLPRTGESIFDLNGPERAAAMIDLADRTGEGWYIPAGDAARYGVTDPADAAWLNARMTAQPLRTYQEPSGVTSTAWRHPGLFVECVPSSLEMHLIERTKQRAEVDPVFDHVVLPTAHNAMVTAPQALTDLLLALPAARRGRQLTA